VKAAIGRVLRGTIFRAGGKKVLARSHVISEEDARMLQTEGRRRPTCRAPTGGPKDTRNGGVGQANRPPIPKQTVSRPVTR
jgi:hypothetical protein